MESDSSASFLPADDVVELSRGGETCTIKAVGPGRVYIQAKVCMSYQSYDTRLGKYMPRYEESSGGLWTINVTQPYTLTFDAQGGDSTSLRSRIVFAGLSYGTLPNVTRNGYQFDGWYTQAEDGEKITSDTVISLRQDHTLYAHWTPVPGTYTVSFDTQYADGVSPENKTVFVGQAYGALPELERVKYYFDGWFTQSEGGEKVTAETIVSLQENHTLYAHWTRIPNACIVSFVSRGASLESKVLFKGQPYGVLPELKRDKFTFDGWFTQPENGEKITAETIVFSEEDHTLYAHWTRNEPLVTDGKCGENAFWHLDEATGTLTISGSGPMDDGYTGSSVQREYGDIIRSLVVEDGITRIGKNNFSGTGLQSVHISDSVTEIGSYAFYECIYLKSVTMGNNVRKIDTYAFMRCRNLTNVSFSENLYIIDSWAFNECSSLRWLNLPETLSVIGYYAFTSCTSLTNVVIPNGVERIREGAFLYCGNLTSVYWPGSLKVLGFAAFDKCGSQFRVYYGGTGAQFNTINLENKIWNYYIVSNDYLRGMQIRINASPTEVLIEPESAVYIDDSGFLAGRLLIPARTDHPDDKKVVYVAAYNKDGQFLGTDLCRVRYLTEGTYGMLLYLDGSIPVEDPSGLIVKAFIMDETYAPLCDATVYQFV